MERSEQQGQTILRDSDFEQFEHVEDDNHGVHRGAPPNLTDEIGATFDDPRQAIKAKFAFGFQSQTRSDFEFSAIPTFDETDMAMVTRHVMFNIDQPNKIFDQIVTFACEETPNNAAYPRQKLVLGYVFEECRFGMYRLQMFRDGKDRKLGLCCDTLDGSAFSLTPFWTALQHTLTESGFLKSEADELFTDEEDDSIFMDSDTEEDGMLLDLTIPENKFLNIGRDPEIIEFWIENIKNPNFSQDTLLSLSFNCLSPENLHIMKDQYAQKLFDAVIASMSTSINVTLPSIRSACVFLDKLAQQISKETVQVTEQSLCVLIDTLSQWTLAQQLKTDVTRSVEVATLLSKNLPTFSGLVSGKIERSGTILETLQLIQQNTEFDDVKNYVRKFRQIFSR